jgi:hypothetical protein
MTQTIPVMKDRRADAFLVVMSVLGGLVSLVKHSGEFAANDGELLAGLRRMRIAGR